MHLEAKGLRVNMGKTKLLFSRPDAPKPVVPSRYPCGVCSRGVGKNSIFCVHCKHWIHKSCSGISGRLKEDPGYKCPACTSGKSNAPIFPGVKQVDLDGEPVEVVSTFCYLGDVTGERGDCYDAITAGMRSAWKAFHELLPLLTCKGISLHSRGHMYNFCVGSIPLFACETCPIIIEDQARSERTHQAMIRWICLV